MPLSHDPTPNDVLMLSPQRCKNTVCQFLTFRGIAFWEEDTVRPKGKERGEEKGERTDGAPGSPKLRALIAGASGKKHRSAGRQLEFGSTGSLGTGESASAWGSHCSFASQRKKKWHLSQVQQSMLGGFASPILSSLFLLPSPSPPPLPVGREKVGGGGGPTGHRRRGGILFSLAFTSRRGSGRYWFSFMCELVPLA